MAAIQSKKESFIDHYNEELDEFIRPRLLEEPVTYEAVTVHVYGCDENSRASVTGGKVVVESFDPAAARDRARREYPIPASGVVSFEIPHGLHYAVHSVVDGLGASFRPVFTASLDERSIDLWNLSLGVWGFGFQTVTEDDENYRVYPVLFDAAAGDEWDDTDQGWDIDGDEYSDDGYPMGVLVSTAEASFLLHGGNKSAENLAWSRSNYGKNVPGLEEYYETAGHDWDAAVELAKKDFAGNFNTDKILLALADKPAALFCAQSPDYMLQTYLPAAGELSLCYQNKAAINSAIENAGPDTAPLDDAWYWSSSACDRIDAWDVDMDGGYVDCNDKDGTYGVLAVSAFLYLY